MTTRIVFVCTGNIARSQIAEGLARALVTTEVEIASAGSRPNPKGVHPMAIAVMRERGIDISAQRPKQIDSLPGPFDYVITLCDDAARSCPALSAKRERIHWPIPDPASVGDDPETQLQFFRNVRDEIERRLREWLPEAHRADASSP